MFNQGLHANILAAMLDLAVMPPACQITTALDQQQQARVLQAEALVCAHEVYVTRKRHMHLCILLRLALQPNGDCDLLLSAVLQMQEGCAVSALGRGQLDALRSAMGLRPSSIARRPQQPAAAATAAASALDQADVEPILRKIRELIVVGVVVERGKGKIKASLKALHTALALAREHLPLDSLVTANLARHTLSVRLAAHGLDDSAAEPWRSYAAAVKEDTVATLPGGLPFELEYCMRRWESGTAFDLRPDESLFLALGPCSMEGAGASIAVGTFVDLMTYSMSGDMLHYPDSALSLQQRILYVQATALAVVEARRRGHAAASAGPGHLAPLVVQLSEYAKSCRGDLVRNVGLMGACGTPVQRQIQEGVTLTMNQCESLLLQASYSGVEDIKADSDLRTFCRVHSEQSMRAAREVDAARGRHACTRPGCDKTEQFSGQFKRCAGLGNTCRTPYCAAECQLQDWRRHKKEDGCRTS